MPLQIVEAETAATGEPGPPEDDETRSKRRDRHTGGTFTVEGQPRRPSKDRLNQRRRIPQERLAIDVELQMDTHRINGDP